MVASRGEWTRHRYLYIGPFANKAFCLANCRLNSIQAIPGEGIGAKIQDAHNIGALPPPKLGIATAGAS